MINRNYLKGNNRANIRLIHPIPYHISHYRFRPEARLGPNIHVVYNTSGTPHANFNHRKLNQGFLLRLFLENCAIQGALMFAIVNSCFSIYYYILNTFRIIMRFSKRSFFRNCFLVKYSYVGEIIFL